MGGVVLLAATDYARCFADLFDGQRAPVFGHLALARAALEAAMAAGWLNEPGVGWAERARRGLWEQVKSAWEQWEGAQAPSEHDDREAAERKLAELDAAKKRLDRWCAVAEPFGWEVLGRSTGRLRVVSQERDAKDDPAFSTCRPWPGVGIDELLLGDVLGPRAHDLGRTQWSYLSGVEHVTWFAMKEAVMVPAEETAEGTSLAGFGTNLGSAQVQAVCVMRAVRLAANRRFQLMGWTDGDWAGAYRDIGASLRGQRALVKAQTAEPICLSQGPLGVRVRRLPCDRPRVRTG
jgi:hypothetical protein